MGFFFGDGGGGAVAGVGLGVAGEGEQLFLDASEQLRHVAARNVGPPEGDLITIYCPL